MNAATLTIAVNLDGAPLESAQATIRLLAEMECPATWVLGQNAAPQFVSQIVAGVGASEIALAAPGTWFDATAGRSGLVAELAQRRRALAAHGMSVSTLRCTALPSRPQLELLVKQGVTALLCDSSADEARSAKRQSGSSLINLRFGLWQAPADEYLPPKGRLEVLAGMRICRAIDRAISTGAALHVAVDLAAARIERTLPRLRRVLIHANRRKAAGTLRLTTISGLVSRQASGASVTRARSILKAA